LLKFFTHPDAQGHLRGLAEEFGDSTNSVRIELNKLEEAGLLQRQVSGQKMVYQVNKANPFYFDKTHTPLATTPRPRVSVML
jgi:DNA-binding transcriptional regulator PaaX